MKQYVLAAAIFFFLVLGVTLAAFNNSNKSAKDNAVLTAGYRWVKLTDNARFRKSYNFDLFAQGDKLWAFHPDGNYYSLDGKDWVKSSLTNSIDNLAFMNYVQFNNSILGLGHFTGNIETYRFTTPVTRTTTFKTWDTLASKTNLPKRFFAQAIVFQNKIWIFGGIGDGEKKYDDAWSSADGITWKKEVEHLAFGPRGRANLVVFRNKLLMLDNDVWESSDGINWKKKTDRITDVVLGGYTAVVFDDKIWLLGCNRNKQFTSEVLMSTDGLTWQKMDAPWSPRGGVAAAVFNGKLYMTGGKYGGFREGSTETEFVYSNDVWALEKLKS